MPPAKSNNTGSSRGIAAGINVKALEIGEPLLGCLYCKSFETKRCMPMDQCSTGCLIRSAALEDLSFRECCGSRNHRYSFHFLRVLCNAKLSSSLP